MARSKAGTFEQFKINGQVVNVGDLVAYELGKKTKSFGSYVGTPGPANITVIDANGRNEGKPMYVNQWKVLGFYVPPVPVNEVTTEVPVEVPTVVLESTGGGEVAKYHSFLGYAEVQEMGEYMDFNDCLDAPVVEMGHVAPKPKKKGRK